MGWHPLKGNHNNHKRKAKISSGGAGLKTMARKFRKYEQVESIAVHLQNTPTHYVNYKIEEDGVNALIALIHEEGVARVVATEEKNVNMSKRKLLQRGRKTGNYKHKKNTKMASLYLQGQKKKLY